MPTVLTVLIRVCALDSKMSPICTLTMGASLEKEIRVHSYRLIRCQISQCLLAGDTRNVSSLFVMRGDHIRYQYFRALLTHVKVSIAFILMSPIGRESSPSIDGFQPTRSRAEANIASSRVDVGNHRIRKIEHIRTYAQNAEFLVLIFPLKEHGI